MEDLRCAAFDAVIVGQDSNGKSGGRYIPYRNITIERNLPPQMERVISVHERTHSGLTQQTTSGIAALACGKQWAIHNVTVVPDSSGTRPVFASPYLKYYGEYARSTHEAVATACEAVFWAAWGGESVDELLSFRPKRLYADPARKYLDMCDLVSSQLNLTEKKYGDEFKAYVTSMFLISCGVAILSPTVPKDFYKTAILGNRTEFGRILAQLRSRETSLLHLSHSELIAVIEPFVEHLLATVEQSLRSPEKVIESRFPGEGNAQMRRHAIDSLEHSSGRSALAVVIATELFKDLSPKMSRELAFKAGIDYHEIVEADVIAAGLDYYLHREGMIRASDSVRPDIGSHESARIDQMELLVGACGKHLHIPQLTNHLFIPEIAGPGAENTFMMGLHVFEPIEGRHVHSFLLDAVAGDALRIHGICKVALSRLGTLRDADTSACFGIVAPFAADETSLKEVLSELDLIRIAHSELPEPEIRNESIIGVSEGNVLIRQLLINGNTAWRTVRYPGGDVFAPSSILDRCYTWILANGGNALHMWAHHHG